MVTNATLDLRVQGVNFFLNRKEKKKIQLLLITGSQGTQMMTELKKLLTIAFCPSVNYSTIEQYTILVYLIRAYSAAAIKVQVIKCTKY